MATADELLVRISADTRKFQRELKKAGATTKEFTVKGVSNNKKLSGALRETAAAAAILQGPLGPISGRINAIGSAIGRVNPLLVGFGVGLAAVTAGMGKSIAAASTLEQQMFKLEALVKATGGAAELSAQDINEFAIGLGEATLTSAGAVREASGILLTFKSISGETFKETLRLAQDMSAVGFGSIQTASLQLAKALEDPVLGLTAMRRSGVSFTDSQKEMIKTLVESNQKLEAQQIILKTVNDQLGGAAVAAAQGLAGAWDTLIERLTRLGEQSAKSSGAMNLLGRAINFVSNEVNDLLDETGGNVAQEITAVEQYAEAWLSVDVAQERLARSSAGIQAAINNVTAARERQFAIATKNVTNEKALAAVRSGINARFQAQLDNLNAAHTASTALQKQQLEELITAREKLLSVVQEEAAPPPVPVVAFGAEDPRLEGKQKLFASIEEAEFAHAQRIYENSIQTTAQMLANDEAAAQKRIQLEKDVASTTMALKFAVAGQTASLFGALSKQHKGWAYAQLAVEKVIAIAQAKINTSLAVTKALALDPTGVLAARTAALGYAQIGLIAATGVVQAAQLGREGGGAAASAGGGTIAAQGGTAGQQAGFQQPFQQQEQVMNFSIMMNMNGEVIEIASARGVKKALENGTLTLEVDENNFQTIRSA